MARAVSNPSNTPGTFRPRRSFTVAEANRALILVRRVAEDIVANYPKLLDFQEMFEASETAGSYHEAQQAQSGMVAAIEKIRECLEELDEIGVELKDWSLGIVDFPSRLYGREIRLCWRHGEPSVAFWHEENSGFAARRSISSLPSEAVGVAAAPETANTP